MASLAQVSLHCHRSVSLDAPCIYLDMGFLSLDLFFSLASVFLSLSLLRDLIPPSELGHHLCASLTRSGSFLNSLRSSSICSCFEASLQRPAVENYQTRLSFTEGTVLRVLFPLSSRFKWLMPHAILSIHQIFLLYTIIISYHVYVIYIMYIYIYINTH